jgi:putative ABC transport system ATP-binding protein
MLQALALGLDYGSGGVVSRAVDEVSLSIPAGSFTGMVGPSGSGKSSLMYLLCGLKRPTRGRVSFEGRDLAAMPKAVSMRLRRERFGFVFQQHFLVNYLTVMENVMVGAVRRDREAMRRALSLLERVGLRDRLSARPYQLSIGQRQRVAVVRALVHRPAVVFADEPTASLDRATGRHVIDLLAEYRRESGGSIVVVTHDPDMLLGADNVFQIRDGRLTSPKGESGFRP